MVFLTVLGPPQAPRHVWTREEKAALEHISTRNKIREDARPAEMPDCYKLRKNIGFI